MTEVNEKNKEIYLDLCKTVWDFDDSSLEYVSKRLSDEWEPVEELKQLIGVKDSTYEDQRIRINVDMSEPTVQSFFEQEDQAYRMFLISFGRAINKLKSKYSCEIGYKEFIENKVIFKKNLTKIKKVFEVIYAEENDIFEMDAHMTYSKEECDRFIVRKFEQIGSSKKSAKKLQLVISFNPIDWLLSSTSESFSSCFNLNNQSGGYQYCLGLPFLCGDKNRMMLYLTDGRKKEFMGIKVDSVQTRTWCILDKSGTFNIVKWYPNDTVGTSPVVAITGDKRFKNRESFSIGKYALDILSTKKGAYIGVYSDMGKLTPINDKLYLKGNDKDGQQIFTKNLLPVNNGRCTINIANCVNGARTLGISSKGYRIPEWKKFGLHIDMGFETLRCSCCSEDKTGFMFRNERFLCYDCYKDKVGRCGICGNEYVKTGNEETVETTDGDVVNICPDCLERLSQITCICCGKISKNSLYSTDDGEKICQSCLDEPANGYIRCDDCSSITKLSKIKYNSYYKTIKRLCNRCSENKEDTSGLFIFGRGFRSLETTNLRGRVAIE